MDIIATYGATFLILAIIFGVFMTWGIGANDVANALGTSVGSGAITVRTAIIVAAIFEFAGAALAGGNVTKTIRKGIIDPSQIADSPEILVYGMLAALLAAGCWLALASSKGWPVSTTHSIVGAIVGFAVAGIGFEAVNWNSNSRPPPHVLICAAECIEISRKMRPKTLLEWVDFLLDFWISFCPVLGAIVEYFGSQNPPKMRSKRHKAKETIFM